MQTSIEQFLKNTFALFRARPTDAATIAAALARHISTPEFSALYAQRTHPSPVVGVGQLLETWRSSMSTATDAMTAAIATLQGQIKSGGVTADQVATQISAAVTPLTTQIQTILTGEGDDASKITDIQAELAEFTTAFAPPASSGSGASVGTAAATTAKAS